MLIRLSALEDKMHRKLRSLGIPEEVAAYVSDDKNGFPLTTKKFVARYMADKMASESLKSMAEFENKHSHELISIRDWLKHARGEGDTDLNMHLYKGWDDMVAAAATWHEWLAEKMGTKGHPLLYRDADAENLVMSFPDGYNIFSVTPGDCRNEGALMGHCVGGYADDVASGRCNIYSLRDENGEPHVTWEVKGLKNGEPYAVQVQGKEDKPPISKYRPYLWEFFARNPEIDTKRVSGRIVFTDGLLQKMEETGLWSLKNFNTYSDFAEEDLEKIGRAYALKLDEDPSLAKSSDPQILTLALRHISPEKKEALLAYLPLTIWAGLVDSRRFAEELIKRAPSTPNLLTQDYIDIEPLEQAFETMSSEEVLLLAQTQGWSDIHRATRYATRQATSKENFAEAFAADFLQHPSILIGKDPRHPIPKRKRTKLVYNENYDENDPDDQPHHEVEVEEGEEDYDDAIDAYDDYEPDRELLERPNRSTAHAGIRLLLKKRLITPEDFPRIALQSDWGILDYLNSEEYDNYYEVYSPLYEGFTRMMEETPELIPPELLEEDTSGRSRYGRYYYVFSKSAMNYALTTGGEAAEILMTRIGKDPEFGRSLTQPEWRGESFPRWEDPIYGVSSRLSDEQLLSQLGDPEGINDLFGDRAYLEGVLPNFIKMGGQYAERVYDAMFAGNWWIYDTLTGEESVRRPVLERFVEEALKNPSLLEVDNPHIVNQAIQLMRRNPGELSDEFFRKMMESGEIDETLFRGRPTNFGKTPAKWGKETYRALPEDLAYNKILERIEEAYTPKKLLIYVDAIPLALWNSEWTPLLMGPILKKYMGFRKALDNWDDSWGNRWEYVSDTSKLREVLSNCISFALVKPDVPPDKLAMGLKAIFDLEGSERGADISNPSRAPFHILNVAQNNPELLTEATSLLPNRGYAEGLSEMITPGSLRARQQALRFQVRSRSGQSSDYMAGEEFLNRELFHVPVENVAYPDAQRTLSKGNELIEEKPDDRQMRMDLSASTRSKVIRLSQLLDVEGLHRISDRIERIL